MKIKKRRTNGPNDASRDIWARLGRRRAKKVPKSPNDAKHVVWAFLVIVDYLSPPGGVKAYIEPR
jgi:hypothetical protein